MKAQISRQPWPIITLGKVCTLEYGKPLKKQDRNSGIYPVFGSNGIVGYHNKYLVKGPFIIVGRKGTAGAVNYSETDGFPIDTTFYVCLKDNVNLKFLYFAMSRLNWEADLQSCIPGLNRNDAYKAKIPLPTSDEQKKIAAVLSQIQENIHIKSKLIERTKELKKSMMKRLFTYGIKGEKTKHTEIGQIPKSWNIKNLSELCDYSTGKTPPRNKSVYWNHEEGFPWATISDMQQDKALLLTKEKVSYQAMKDCFSNKFAKKGTLLMSFKLTIGRTCFAGCDLVHNEAIISIYPKKGIDQSFLSFYLPTVNYNQYQDRQIKGNTLNKSKINKIKIPLPPLEEQKKIADILQKVDEMIRNYEEQKGALQDLFKSMLHQLMTAQIRLHNIDINISKGFISN